MKRISQEMNVRNQWTQGWNIGRYGKLPSAEKVKDQNSDWQTGFLVGVKERKDNKESKTLLRKKRLLSLFGYLNDR